MPLRNLLLALLSFAVLAAACGGGPATDQQTAATAQAPTTTAAALEPEEPAALPGEGVSAVMARGNWPTGYFQAELVRQMMQMLGYEVSDPAEAELGPSLAYLSMAQGDTDFWVNSWYPLHNSWLEAEMPDGSSVADHVQRTGALLAASALQGYLISKPFAEEYGIDTLDDLNNNPDALAVYDASDPDPGNGIADIYGCPESWTCDDVIDSQITFSGWENIRQVLAGYDALIAEAIAKAEAGEPVVAYTWAPSSYITKLRPGDNVVWLGVDEVLDDSNPLGREGGEAWDQRPGAAPIEPEACPHAAELGTCRLGWLVADITATANRGFLEDNPAAAKLLEIVELNIVDVSLQIAEQDDGADIGGLVTRWIADNQDRVDAWIAEASAAA